MWIGFEVKDLRKFFVGNNQIENDSICISGTDVNHIKNVLRLEVGTKILVCDKDLKKNYISEIMEITSEMVKCKIIEEVESTSESNVTLDIYQGLPKADKMELVIQKGTELGVNKFIPVKMERCIVKLDQKDEMKKIDRWNKISEVASKQSGRDIVPEVSHVYDLKDVQNVISDYDLFIVCFENEKENTIKNELVTIKTKKQTYKVAVLIGPEGGLAEGEVQALKQSGAKVVTLGNRILRTETVALSVASIIMYELEM